MCVRVYMFCLVHRVNKLSKNFPNSLFGILSMCDNGELLCWVNYTLKMLIIDSYRVCIFLTCLWWLIWVNHIWDTSWHIVRAQWCNFSFSTFIRRWVLPSTPRLKLRFIDWESANKSQPLFLLFTTCIFSYALAWGFHHKKQEVKGAFIKPILHVSRKVEN